MFHFKHVQSLENDCIKSDQPMVVFASPGMLHGGFSLQIFKEWAGNERNALIIPGYCQPGTIGNKVLMGEKKINIDDRDVDVRIRVFNMSFSAHADSKGIMELLSHLEPRNVMLVHGEKEKMKVLCQQVKDQLQMPCYYPANHTLTKIPTEPKVYVSIAADIINRMN
jgi:integrator complex subunit 11